MKNWTSPRFPQLMQFIGGIGTTKNRQDFPIYAIYWDLLGLLDGARIPQFMWFIGHHLELSGIIVFPWWAQKPKIYVIYWNYLDVLEILRIHHFSLFSSFHIFLIISNIPNNSSIVVILYSFPLVLACFLTNAKYYIVIFP